MDEYLGKMSDNVIAKKFGVPVSEVKKRRKELGIEKYKRPSNREIAQYLGKIPDNQIAKKFGVSRQWVRVLRKRRGIAKARIGIPDDEIKITENQINESTLRLAEKYGVSPYRIERIKNRLRREESELAKKIKKLPYKELTDREISERLGVSWRKVQMTRLKHGLLKSKKDV